MGLIIMIVNELNMSRSFSPIEQQKASSLGVTGSSGPKFSDTLNELIDDTNSLQKEADVLRDKFIKGEAVDLHDVMISAQKAKTSFELLMELRNKAIDLYRETLRMQV